MEEKPEGFKSRLDDVFGGLDGVGFKSDSSLKQTPYEADKESEFRRPKSPPSRGCVRSGDNRDSSRGGSFDQFKKTDSIFQESQDVGGWRKKDFRPTSSSNRVNDRRGGGKRPKNPMYDHRRPQHKDPSKYTKYSLADVKDVTDKSNAQAALSFLQERKRKHEPDDDDDHGDVTSGGGKVVFKKPKKIVTTESLSSASSSVGLSCGNSKRVMPEAVVGQTKAKKAAGSKVAADTENPAAKKKSSKKQNRLSHLNFDDEEEEED